MEKNTYVFLKVAAFTVYRIRFDQHCQVLGANNTLALWVTKDPVSVCVCVCVLPTELNIIVDLNFCKMHALTVRRGAFFEVLKCIFITEFALYLLLLITVHLKWKMIIIGSVSEEAIIDRSVQIPSSNGITCVTVSFQCHSVCNNQISLCYIILIG